MHLCHPHEQPRPSQNLKVKSRAISKQSRLLIIELLKIILPFKEGILDKFKLEWYTRTRVENQFRLQATELMIT